MGWCDDPKAKKYNKLVKLPYKFKTEKLFKTNNTYDIILVLNYNSNPVRKNKKVVQYLYMLQKKTLIAQLVVWQLKKNILKILLLK